MQYRLRRTHCLDIGLLDMPFIQSGQSHRNAFPTKTHTAFHQLFTAHMKSPGAGQTAAQCFDHFIMNPCANQHLGPLAV